MFILVLTRYRNALENVKNLGLSEKGEKTTFSKTRERKWAIFAFLPRKWDPQNRGVPAGPFLAYFDHQRTAIKKRGLRSTGYFRRFLEGLFDVFCEETGLIEKSTYQRVLDKKGTFSRSPKLVFWQCLFTCKKREKGSKTPPFGPANSTFTCNYEVNVFTESHEPKKDQKHPKNGFIKERPARPPSKNGQISSYSYT